MDSLEVVQATDGSQLWQYTAPTPFYSTVANGMVYVLTQEGRLFVLRASTGSPVWSRELHVSNLPPFLFLAGGVIYVETSDGGNIAALRASDGSVLWRYSPPVPATQVIPALTDNLVLMALQDGNVATLSASSGSLRWHRYVDG